MRSLLALAVVVSACSDNHCAAPTWLADGSSTAPGEIRHAAIIHGGTFSAGPNGVGCISCGTLYDLGPPVTLRAKSSLADAPTQGSSVFLVAAADSSFYRLDYRPAEYVPCVDPSGFASQCSWQYVDVTAVARDGTKRWKAGPTPFFDEVVADADAVYFLSYQIGNAPFPPAPTLTAWSSADGSMLWQQTLSSSSNPQGDAYSVLARPGGGVVVVQKLYASPLVMTALDTSGAMQWARTVSGTPASLIGATLLTPIVPIDANTIALIVPFSGTVDFGDRQLAVPATSIALAELDATTTRWAYAIPAPKLSTSQSSDSLLYDTVGALADKLLVTGSYTGADAFGLGPSASPAGDAFLAVFTATGLDHALRIGGPAAKAAGAPLAAADGSVWLAVETYDPVPFCDPTLAMCPDKPLVGASGLTIGATTYTNPHDQGTTYLVNLAP